MLLGYDFVQPLESPVDGGPALRAEVERCPMAFVPNANVRQRFAVGLDGRRSKAGLRAEYAAGTALTRETVTDGYPDGLFGHRHRELATTARCDARGHGSIYVSSRLSRRGRGSLPRRQPSTQ